MTTARSKRKATELAKVEVNHKAHLFMCGERETESGKESETKHREGGMCVEHMARSRYVLNAML